MKTDQLGRFLTALHAVLACSNDDENKYDDSPFVGVDRLTARVLEARHALEACAA